MAATDDAIVTSLRGDSTLVAMLPDGVYGIGHSEVEPGTRAPYIIVADAMEDVAYVFGNKESSSEQYYKILGYFASTPTESAQQVASAVLNRIYTVLMSGLTIAGRTNVTVSRGARLVSKFEVFSDTERYFKDGYNWTVWSAPDL